jgi:DNA-directed RNA polymerase specialized sigma24 family protein
MPDTTRWSLILAARGDGDATNAALAALCSIYRPVVLAHLRRRGAAGDAEDATQAFFVHFLERRLDARAEQPRGSFRAFLFTAVENHRRGQARAAGAGKRHATWVGEDALDGHADPQPDAAAQFDRDWALQVVARARDRLREEATRNGKGDLFRALDAFLGEAPDRADYASVAAMHGLAANTVAVAVKRLRERLRALVRRELADTLAPDADLDAEMEWLRRALRPA